MVVDLFRSRKSLEAEVVALRQQLNILLRRSGHKRPALSRFDRLVFVGLYRFVPSVLDAVMIVRPETIVRWHRAGFRAFWHWKSRAKGAGRPQVPVEVRQLIRDMSLTNPLWGAPRIHGDIFCGSSSYRLNYGRSTELPRRRAWTRQLDLRRLRSGPGEALHPERTPVPSLLGR